MTFYLSRDAKEVINREVRRANCAADFKEIDNRMRVTVSFGQRARTFHFTTTTARNKEGVLQTIRGECRRVLRDMGAINPKRADVDEAADLAADVRLDAEDKFAALSVSQVEPQIAATVETIKECAPMLNAKANGHHAPSDAASIMVPSPPDEAESARTRVALRQVETIACSRLLMTHGKEINTPDGKLFEYAEGWNDARVRDAVTTRPEIRVDHIAKLRREAFGSLIGEMSKAPKKALTLAEAAAEIATLKVALAKSDAKASDLEARLLKVEEVITAPAVAEG